MLVRVNLIEILYLIHDYFIIKFILGENWTSKVDRVRNALKKVQADAMIVTALPEIAWLLNIRGRDIPYNPFVKSYVIVSHNEVRLYVDNWKLTKNNIMKYLNIEYGVRIYSVLYVDRLI